MQAYTGDADLFGLTASDLQNNAVVVDNTVSGTLNKIPTDSEFYTNAGFDASLGTNFVVVKAEPTDDSNTVEFTFNGNTHTLDSDMILVLQMTNAKKSLKVTFTEKNGATTVSTYELKLSGLYLA